MSRELSDWYQHLAADADAGEVGVPGELRRRADRRARLRAVGGALAVAMLAGGVVIGTQVVAMPPPAPVGPPADTPTIPTPSVSAGPPSPTTSGRPPGTTPASPGRIAGGIPDRAFFTLAPANQTGVAPEDRDLAALPGLCGARIPSEPILHRRSRSLVYKLPKTPQGNGPDGTYTQSITVYGSGRATVVLEELRQAVRDCPEQPQLPFQVPQVLSRQRLLGDTGYGDESVLFELRKPAQDMNGDPIGGEEVRLVRAIRVGDVVTILWEKGSGTGSSSRTQVDTDSRRAVAAIEAWLD
ncbi:hypothetical protein ACGFH8_26490 [Micromonospora sp. NPDC049175]|uniref:hypothetical protein n=1 Tax=Micromonospora sp. NPDC049175 TaxID=3364266 RepID=UPI003710AD56